MDKSTHQIRCEQWTRIINECLVNIMVRRSRQSGVARATCPD